MGSGAGIGAAPAALRGAVISAAAGMAGAAELDSEPITGVTGSVLGWRTGTMSSVAENDVDERTGGDGGGAWLMASTGLLGWARAPAEAMVALAQPGSVRAACGACKGLGIAAMPAWAACVKVGTWESSGASSCDSAGRLLGPVPGCAAALVVMGQCC